MLQFTSQGNSELFGSLTVARRNVIAVSDKLVEYSWRICGSLNTIDFITIASLGNATDFGDLTASKVNGSCSKCNKRCIWVVDPISCKD